MNLKISKKMFSIVYILFGLINLAIFSLSKFSIFYLALVGILCLIAGAGLWRGLNFSVWLVISLSFILTIIGIISFYASINLMGFNPNQSILLLNLAIIIYTVVSLLLVVYIVIKRKTVFLKI